MLKLSERYQDNICFLPFLNGAQSVGTFDFQLDQVFCVLLIGSLNAEKVFLAVFLSILHYLSIRCHVVMNLGPGDERNCVKDAAIHENCES